MAIEAQQYMGWEGLLEEDQYLAEVNLEDLKHTLGKQQEASRLQRLSQTDVCRRRAAMRGFVHT
jgi:hypothetical protein